MTFLMAIGIFVAWIISGIIYHKIVGKLVQNSDIGFFVHTIGIGVFPFIYVLLWPIDLFFRLLFLVLKCFNWIIRKSIGVN